MPWPEVLEIGVMVASPSLTSSRVFQSGIGAPSRTSARRTAGGSRRRSG
jgi:hypothetical protein